MLDVTIFTLPVTVVGNHATSADKVRNMNKAWHSMSPRAICVQTSQIGILPEFVDPYATISSPQVSSQLSCSKSRSANPVIVLPQASISLFPQLSWLDTESTLWSYLEPLPHTNVRNTFLVPFTQAGIVHETKLCPEFVRDCFLRMNEDQSLPSIVLVSSDTQLELSVFRSCRRYRW